MLVERRSREMGRLDVLVNALGINRPQLPEKSPKRTGMQFSIPIYARCFSSVSRPAAR